MTQEPQPYLPAAGKDVFLPLYDPLTKLFGIEKRRRALIEQAELRPGFRVLDVGCGTGSLLAEVAKRERVSATGLDPDPKALAIAARKLKGSDVKLDRGYADALPYESATFDRVLSSFMLHHLAHEKQAQMLREARRVLKPGGRLELLDLDDGGRHGLARMFHAQPQLAHNAPDQVLALLKSAGFDARVVQSDGRVVCMVYYQGIA